MSKRKRDDTVVEIDGSLGEGGGQVLRTSLALAGLTGKKLHLRNIRAGRSKPGLLRQHLTALEAAAEVTGAKVEGAALRSTELWFEPGTPRGGDYRFSVGTAGSANLVCQTVLPLLLFAEGGSAVTFEGGTHNDKAPTWDDMDRVFFPLLRRMGVETLSTWIDRHGFYPAGGGRFQVVVEPWKEKKPLRLEEVSPPVQLRAWALVANIPKHVAARELRTLRELLPLEKNDCAPREVESPGPGNVAQVLVVGDEHHGAPELFTAFGAPRKPAEDVAAEVAARVHEHLAREVPVGPHLADQLLLPMALGAGGSFVTGPLSLHTKTNIEVIGQFLDRPIHVRSDAQRSRYRVEL